MGLLISIIGGVACLRFGAGMLVPLQGAAAGCCLRVLLEGAAVRVNAGTVRVVCALWSGILVPLQGAAARCHWKVPLQDAAWCRWQVSLQGSA